MVEMINMRQDIPLDNFMSIFVSSALVMVFGGFYVGIFTAVKIGMLKRWAMVVAYLFWILTAYCLYLMGSLMLVGEFTAKALVVAGLGLLLLPHAVYYMQDKVHKENEH